MCRALQHLTPLSEPLGHRRRAQNNKADLLASSQKVGEESKILTHVSWGQIQTTESSIHSMDYIGSTSLSSSENGFYRLMASKYRSCLQKQLVRWWHHGFEPMSD